MKVEEIDNHVAEHSIALKSTGKLSLKSAWTIAKPILLFLDNTVLVLRPKWQVAVKNLIAAIDDYINAA